MAQVSLQVGLLPTAVRAGELAPPPGAQAGGGGAFKQQALSAIRLVLSTPTARRLRWVLGFHRGSLSMPHLVRFLHALQRHRRKKVLLLCDRLPMHRSRMVKHVVKAHRAWLQIADLGARTQSSRRLMELCGDTTLVNTPVTALTHLPPRARTPSAGYITLYAWDKV